MYRIRLFYICFFYGLFYCSLDAQTVTVRQYIELYKNAAMLEMIESRIPASITLAQGLLESGSGNSRLATTGNNHFGIKCKKDWTGCTILEDDDDLKECFRCYTSGEESYKDHSKFLKGNKRYAALFTLEISDYKGWSAGLLSAGYATNQKYTDLLISCIERNKLAQYDTLIVNGYNPYSRLMPANIELVNSKNLPLIVMQPEQTLESIAEQNNKTEKKLAKYNDLSYHRIEPGDVIYLKPKKRKAGVATHIVSEGENMWLISQKYAIRLQSLYKKNLMDKGTEASPGSVLQLQQKAEIMPDTSRINNGNLPPLNGIYPVLITEKSGHENNISYHTVLVGETFYSISKLYNISVEDIKKNNKLTDNNLNIGQKLKISNSQSVGSSSQARWHSVKSGETLYSISKLYSINIDMLKKLNNLTSDTLAVGQILVIQ